jgi:hypothetical protein
MLGHVTGKEYTILKHKFHNRGLNTFETDSTFYDDQMGIQADKGVNQPPEVRLTISEALKARL